MKKIISLAVGATAMSMAIFGTGVAAAEDYAGQTSSNASRPAKSPHPAY